MDKMIGSEVPDSLLPTHTRKTLGAMKAQRMVKRMTLNPSEAKPGETLYVRVPKQGENEVIVPGPLALRFNINLSGGHANNFLVQNVSRALVSDMKVKFGTTILQDIDGYDIFKIYEDLFLSQEQRDNMLLEGIQSEDLTKIRSNAGDKKTSGVDAEKKLNEIYRTKYIIRLDNEILTDHGVFYPKALYEVLSFEVILSKASQVVKGSDNTKLNYRLTNIQLEYEMIRSELLAEEARSVYSSSKEFAYDYVQYDKKVTLEKGSDTRVNINVDFQRRSMKAILLFFIDPYLPGTRDSEKYVFPNLTKVRVTINGKSNMIYDQGIVSTDLWAETSRFLVREKHKTEHMGLKLFFTGDRFGLVIDLRSMADRTMHGSGTRLVNSTDGVQLELDRTATRSGKLDCMIFLVADGQFNILGNQLESVQH